MSNCIYCSSILRDTGAFCPQCAKQSKCKNCGELLAVGDKACASCGTLIGEGSQINLSGYDNIFELNETAEFEGGKSNRSIRVGCSDDAVLNFGEFVEKRLKGSQSFGGARPTKDVFKGAALPSGESFNDFEESSEGDDSTEVKRPSDLDLSEKEILNDIFRKVDGKWRLDEIALNATGKLDYARRLTFLFLYLSELEGRTNVPRSELNTILNDSAVYDGNTRTWIANEPSISSNGDDLSLNAGGRRNAKESIKNLSKSIADQWLPGKKQATSKSSVSSEKEGKEAGRKGSGKKNPRTSVIIEKWKTLGHKFNGHSIFSNRTVLDKALLALWAIRKATKDEIKVVSSAQIARFLFDVFEIKVHKRSVENSLKDKDVKNKVTKESASSFQILPPGMDYIEKIIKS